MHPLQIPAQSAQAFRIKQAALLNLASLSKVLSFIKEAPFLAKIQKWPVGKFMFKYNWVPTMFVNMHNEARSPSGTSLRNPTTGEYITKTMKYLPSVYDALDWIT